MNKMLELSNEEIEMLTLQISARCDELDKYIQEKAKRGQNFDGTYELKKNLLAIRDRLYRL